MAKEQEVMAIMEALVIATDKDVGQVMAARGHWSEGQSARVNSLKTLKKLVELGKLEKGEEGFYRLPGCRSEFKGHAQALTKALVEILKLEGKDEG